MSEIDDILGRIKSNKSVEGYLISNTRGEIIKTSYKGEKKAEGDKIMANIPDVVAKAQIGLKNINASNELQFMRIKTKTNEFLIAPDKDNEFLFIVVQTPNVKGGTEQSEP